MSAVSGEYESIERIPIKGKVVAIASKGKDAKGYDFVSIVFTDGTSLRMLEQGQAGYFTTELVKP